MEASIGAGPAGNGRSVATRRAPSVLEPSLGPATGKTHGVALSCQYPDGALTDLAYISRQPLRPADHLAGHVLRRAGRGRRLRRFWCAALRRFAIRRTVVRRRSVVDCPLASVTPSPVC